jgi:hypothetical protein
LSLAPKEAGAAIAIPRKSAGRRKRRRLDRFMPLILSWCIVIRILGLFLLSVLSAAAQHQLAHDILQQLIGINTTDSVGDNTAAARAMATRFSSVSSRNTINPPAI